MKTLISILGCFYLATCAGLYSSAADLNQSERASLGSSGTNRVLVLDGKTGSVRVPDSPSLRSFTDAITIEAWFKAASFYEGQGTVNSILRKNLAANSENFFLRFRNVNGRPWVEATPGMEIGLARVVTSFQTNTWYHLAVTYDGKALRVFVNGAEFAIEARSGPMRIDESALYIGRGDPEFSFGEFFHGALDEIRLWNVARTPEQLRAAMNTSLSGSEPGLVAYWDFDDNTLTDRSRHGNDGQREGGARIMAEIRPRLDPGSERSTASFQMIEARLAVLEALWTQLDEIYPALEYKGIYGREWIAPAEARIRDARSDAEFHVVLLELMASLRDTHSRILGFPNEPRQISPPVLLNQVDENVAVIRAGPKTTLSPGDIVRALDGRPVERCLAEQMKLVCQSTERGRVREACERLLRGAPGTALTMTVEGADGREREVPLTREPDSGFWSEPSITHRRLNDSVGYIRIARWHGDGLVETFDRALEEFRDIKGLIIDVRGNGGGNDQLADLINGRLTDKAVISSIDFWRERGTDRYQRTIGWVRPRGPWTYAGRVAVLIDEASMSACEHFVSGVEAMGNVLMVGTPTNGAGGGPTRVELPDGTQMAISRALGVRANGVVFEGHGIPPHIVSTPTLEDLRAGRDAAVELSQDWLLSDRPVPARSQSLPANSKETKAGPVTVYDTAEKIASSNGSATFGATEDSSRIRLTQSG